MLYIMNRVMGELSGPRVLELGCGSGQWTDKLLSKGYQVSVVEGSHILAENLRARIRDRAKITHCLFEEYQPTEKYNDIIKFAKDEQPEIDLTVVRAADAVAKWARQGIDYCMNTFN